MVTRQQVAAPPVQLTAAPGSRLEALQASYDSAKAALDDAKALFESLTDALKNEMAAAAPAGSTNIRLAGPVPLRLRWKTPWRFDVKRFRAERPELYVQYEVQGGNWELRAD